MDLYKIWKCATVGSKPIDEYYLFAHIHWIKRYTEELIYEEEYNERLIWRFALYR